MKQNKVLKNKINKNFPKKEVQDQKASQANSTKHLEKS